MSDDNEPELPASEQPKSTRERKPRKRSTKPKTTDSTKKCRTFAREMRREPAAHATGGMKRRRGRKVQSQPAHDTHFWVAISLVGGFVVVGIMQAANGDGAMVLSAFGTAVAGITGYLYGRSRGGK